MAFWLSRPKTVKANLNNMKKVIRNVKELKIPVILSPIGCWPIEDTVGCSQALAELRASQGKGRYHDSYMQYETVRKMRSCITNGFQASVAASRNEVALVGIKGAPFHLSRCHTDSIFFTMFNKGMRQWMGRDVRPNRALDHRILHIILRNMESRIRDTEIEDEEKRWMLMVGFYFIISFVLSLRGNEGFMLEAQGLVDNIDFGKEDWVQHPHVVIPLLGRFKNEDGARKHKMLAAAETDSRFKVRNWTEAIVQLLKEENNLDGPAICDAKGFFH